VVKKRRHVQNLWVATNQALYVSNWGEDVRRFDAADGLHLQSNPVCYDDSLSSAEIVPGTLWSRFRSWISEIVGGGPNEVFVGTTEAYLGRQRRPLVRSGRHTGKLDRVRLSALRKAR